MQHCLNIWTQASARQIPGHNMADTVDMTVDVTYFGSPWCILGPADDVVLKSERRWCYTRQLQQNSGELQVFESD